MALEEASYGQSPRTPELNQNQLQMYQRFTRSNSLVQDEAVRSMDFYGNEYEQVAQNVDLLRSNVDQAYMDYLIKKGDPRKFELEVTPDMYSNDSKARNAYLARLMPGVLIRIFQVADREVELYRARLTIGEEFGYVRKSTRMNSRDKSTKIFLLGSGAAEKQIKLADVI